ncbi:hypothetical protein PTSG_06077 [Salpingoeca rosetta]|uniref:fructokinase n=1 Tax=Salpingoeca rosetta (strain ATCC 50818 / BSB-021) TaxID=946362 RepID=F2UDM1_SALR5|nr:uncharacterized protein PTSG_06077 [Salpingoeca rosetta]EGD74716.1 hypothetical protein PTSG_06077 [Salpingoeca rosetta]|eukprot:XP_004992973.1 hypothetical protein PTSG_06077 [Salpingoeca rosetta]
MLVLVASVLERVLGAVVSAIGGACGQVQQATSQQRPKVFAGVEGGGQTWRVAIAVGSPTNITERAVFETKKPETTLPAIRAWLDEHEYDALGIATFGPIEPKRDHPEYGYITSTPKPHWKNANVVAPLWNGRVPHKFDTDVNAPALAEFKAHGEAMGHSSCAYITVGTGVGVGLVINGKPVHGLLHPEGGHVKLARSQRIVI